MVESISTTQPSQMQGAIADTPSIQARLEHLRASTNFSSKSYILRDKHLILNVFVNYE